MELDVNTVWNSTDRLLGVAPCPPPWNTNLLFSHACIENLSEEELGRIVEKCDIKRPPPPVGRGPVVLGGVTVGIIVGCAFVFVLLVTIIYCSCKRKSHKDLADSSNSFTSETELTPGSKQMQLENEVDSPVFSIENDITETRSYDSMAKSNKPGLLPDSEMLDTIGVKNLQAVRGVQKGKIKT